MNSNSVKKKAAALGLVGGVGAIVALAGAAYGGAFSDSITVYVDSPRTGLVMDQGAKVMLHGVQVGSVQATRIDGPGTRLVLEIPASTADRIAADVSAEIKATTAFGAKYVDLQPAAPADSGHLTDGSTVVATNVTTEVNTVFQNLSEVLDAVDADKLNATLGAIAGALQGRGDQLGQTFDVGEEYLRGLNPSLPELTHDLRQLATVSDVYAQAAPDLVGALKNSTGTSVTIVDQRENIEALLLGVTGLANSGNDLVGQNKDGVVTVLDLLRPTSDLLMKYNGVITCFIEGLSQANKDVNAGIRGATQVLDSAVILGDDPYRYGQDLPVVEAKGGHGGVAGDCGSLPVLTADEYPAPYVVTNTGTTGNPPGPASPQLGSPSFVQYLIGSYNSQFGGNGVPK